VEDVEDNFLSDYNIFCKNKKKLFAKKNPKKIYGA
jgi:hypothetical protein